MDDEELSDSEKVLAKLTLFNDATLSYRLIAHAMGWRKLTLDSKRVQAAILTLASEGKVEKVGKKWKIIRR